MFEAFKAGAIDARPEDDPTRWTEGYNIPPVRDGRIVKEEFPVAVPAGMSALVFNTRRPLFADQRVREALIKLFDFEWINRTLYHGQYARTESYFARSELSARMGAPPTSGRRRCSRPTPSEVKPKIMDGTFAFPVSDGTGENREGRKEALALLEQAGYRLEKGKLRDKTRRAGQLRDPRRHQSRGTAAAHLCPRLEAGRHRGAHPPGRLGAISAAQADLRLRHDPI